MQTRTILDRIEVEPQTGNAFIKLQKCRADGSTQPHRTVIEPSTATADQIAAVNAQLSAMGYPALSAGDVAQIEAAIATIAPVRATKATERAALEQAAAVQRLIDERDAAVRKVAKEAAEKAVFDTAVTAAVEKILAQRAEKSRL